MMRVLTIAVAGSMVLFALAYLHYHPGYQSRPGVGEPVSELETWLEDRGYQRLEGRSAGPNLYEWSAEVRHNGTNLEIWNDREETGRLLTLFRFSRSQRLCGMGVYFVHWRPDQTGSTIAEIIYQDQFCHI